MAVEFFRSLAFDGINDLVDCGNPLDFQITNYLTVNTWVECGSQVAGDVIMSKGKDSTSQHAWMLGFDDVNSSRLRSYVSRDGTVGPVTTKLYRSTSSLLASDWHMVTALFANNTLAIAIDAVFQGLSKVWDPTVNTLHNSTFRMALGAINDGAAHLHGELFNPSIWDTALCTVADLEALYASGLSGDPKLITPTGGANLVESFIRNGVMTYPTVVGNVAANNGTMIGMDASDIVASPFLLPWTSVIRPYAHNRATKISDGSQTSWASPPPAADTEMVYHPDGLYYADYQDFVVTRIG